MGEPGGKAVAPCLTSSCSDASARKNAVVCCRLMLLFCRRRRSAMSQRACWSLNSLLHLQFAFPVCVQRAALKAPRPADARSPSRDSWPFQCDSSEASSGPLPTISSTSPWEWAANGTPSGQHVLHPADKLKKELQTNLTKSSSSPSRKKYRVKTRRIKGLRRPQHRHTRAGRDKGE